VIYRALGFDMPKFAHVSMILGKDGKRLSKRHGALSVLEYRDNGILPEALVNYLVRLGWSHGDREVFRVAELKELFDLDAVTKSAARFDDEKLLWLNSEHIKTEPEGRLAPLVRSSLASRGVTASAESVAALLPMLRERSKTINGLADSMKYFFIDKVEYQEKAAKKFLTRSVAPVLSELAERLTPVDFTDKDKIENTFRALVEERGIKLKDLAQPARVAFTGGTVSPGLFDVMEALGKEKCVDRIATAVRFITDQA
jgi:glutamyl-tRNA synthetase